MAQYENLTKSVRIWILVLSVFISILLICNIVPVNKDNGWGVGNGLRYGLDFAGGTEIWLRLENVSSEVANVERAILETRLNAMGLKDIPVNVYGNQYIIVKVAKASPEDIRAIEALLEQQANFEERIDGELAVKGDEISVDLGTGRSGAYPEGSGYGWVVGVKLMGEGSCRFGKVAQGKFFGENNPSNRPVDIFLDRPQNTTIIMTESLHGLLGNTTSKAVDRHDDIYYGNTGLEVIEMRSRIPIVVVYPDLNRTLSELKDYQAKGYNKAIIAEDEGKIPESVRNLVADLGISTQRIPVSETEVESGIKNLTGLKSTPMLNFDTRGECVYGAQITGGAPTKKEAEDEVRMNQIWLSSGNLPTKAVIESKSSIPASLGAQFLRYSLITGIIGILCVALVIFVRYHKLFIVVPVMVTGFSEIIIILGITTLIGGGWEIDLPAIAGIIAAVGTGVDNQIVITDETIASVQGVRKSVSVAERIRRAFFIIFTSALTIVAVMLPLMTFVAGTLKGFALITMLGVAIGVLITRPAYAKIIEELIKAHE